MAMALAGAKAGTLSCSLASSSVKAAGKRSERVEKSCPTLMKVGPSFSKDSLCGSPNKSKALVCQAGGCVKSGQVYKLRTYSSSPDTSLYGTLLEVLLEAHMYVTVICYMHGMLSSMQSKARCINVSLCQLWTLNLCYAAP